MTVPEATAPLHLHGWSTELRHGGHLHHEHPDIRLGRLESLAICPQRQLLSLGADLMGGLGVVVDDRYSDHRDLRLSWLAAGAAQGFSLALPLDPGPHELVVLADPEQTLVEARVGSMNQAGSDRARAQPGWL